MPFYLCKLKIFRNLKLVGRRFSTCLTLYSTARVDHVFHKRVATTTIFIVGVAINADSSKQDSLTVYGTSGLIVLDMTTRWLYHFNYQLRFKVQPATMHNLPSVCIKLEKAIDGAWIAYMAQLQFGT